MIRTRHIHTKMVLGTDARDTSIESTSSVCLYLIFSNNAVLLINIGTDFEVIPCSQIFN